MVGIAAQVGETMRCDENGRREERNGLVESGWSLKNFYFEKKTIKKEVLAAACHF